MNKKTKNLIAFIIVIIGIVIGMTLIAGGAKTSASYSNFSQCLADSDATFYGAFWCPHCQDQEKALGVSRRNLERMGLYTECSTADGRGQTQACIDAGIEGYPTWEFADGERVSGKQELTFLSEKTGCVLAPDEE